MQCRLCLNSNPELLWNVAQEDKSVINTVRWYVFQATGLKIEDSDLVPCVMCHNCIAVSVNIYWFRKDAIKNDKWIKEKFGQHYSPPLTRYEDMIDILEEEKCNLPDFVKNLQVKRGYFEDDLKTEADVDDNDPNVDCKVDVEEHSIDLKNERPKTPSPQKVLRSRKNIESSQQAPIPNMHSTVEKLLVANPGLNIPDDIRNCHINPVIELCSVKKPPQNNTVSKEFFTSSLELVPTQNVNHNKLVRVGKSDNIYICSVCNELLPSKKKLNLHKKNHHYLCNMCYANFPKKTLLEQHIQDFHPETEKSLSYSIKNRNDMKLTLQKNDGNKNSAVSKPVQSNTMAEEIAETDYVKYLLVNRYMHKTQQESQTSYRELLPEPVTELNTIHFRGITKDLETSKIPVQIKISNNGLKGRFIHTEESPQQQNTTSYDFSHITPIAVVPLADESLIIDLVNSPTTNHDKSSQRKRSRLQSIDARTYHVQAIVNCDSDSDNENANSQQTVDCMETPKKLRVKHMWEVN